MGPLIPQAPSPGPGTVTTKPGRSSPRSAASAPELTAAPRCRAGKVHTRAHTQSRLNGGVVVPSWRPHGRSHSPGVLPGGPAGTRWTLVAEMWPPGGKLTQGLSKVSRCPPARAGGGASLASESSELRATRRHPRRRGYLDTNSSWLAGWLAGISAAGLGWPGRRIFGTRACFSCWMATSSQQHLCRAANTTRLRYFPLLDHHTKKKLIRPRWCGVVARRYRPPESWQLPFAHPGPDVGLG